MNTRELLKVPIQISKAKLFDKCDNQYHLSSNIGWVKHSVCLKKEGHGSDIKWQIRSIYYRGNTFIFGKCSDDVKVQLFKYFWSNLYCGLLWSNYRKCIYIRMWVANSFNGLLQIDRRCSVPKTFIGLDVDYCSVVMRKHGF